MKISGYILAVYLVLLAVVPCCAFDECPDDKSTTEQTEDHKAGDNDCGVCSPFFNCEGCASVTVHFNTVSFTFITPEVKRVYAEYIPSLIPDVHYDFWQPPRLG